MWSLARPEGEVLLRLPEGAVGPFELKVDALAFVNPAHPQQTVNVIVNDTKLPLGALIKDRRRASALRSSRLRLRQPAR